MEFIPIQFTALGTTEKEELLEHNWTYEKALAGNLIAYPGWLTTDYIPIGPTKINFQATSTCTFYNSAKQIIGYVWGTPPHPEGSKDIWRNEDVGPYNGQAYVRISSENFEYQFLRIEQDGKVIFDGSKYKVNFSS